MLVGTGALVTATAGMAAAIGAPVMIDDFSGTHGGTRTVTLMPGPGESTTAPGTFRRSGGLATMTMTGNGNRVAGVGLSYAMNNVDLTSAGNNTQFFLEFGSIQRLPVQNLGETAASISIQVTDANGVTGVYNTGISNVIGWNVVLNFNCSPGQSACFSPQPNFTNVTNVTVEVRYPQSSDTGPASRRSSTRSGPHRPAGSRRQHRPRRSPLRRAPCTASSATRSPSTLRSPRRPGLLR